MHVRPSTRAPRVPALMRLFREVPTSAASAWSVSPPDCVPRLKTDRPALGPSVESWPNLNLAETCSLPVAQAVRKRVRSKEKRGKKFRCKIYKVYFFNFCSDGSLRFHCFPLTLALHRVTPSLLLFTSVPEQKGYNNTLLGKLQF